MTAQPAERAEPNSGKRAEPDGPVEEPAAPDGEPAEKPERNRDRRRLGWMIAPLAIYALSRLVQVRLIDWMLPPATPGALPPTVREKLMTWDAGWFVRVAEDGYPHAYQYGPDGHLLGSTVAFFPGYPLLIRLVHLTGAGYVDSALAIAWTAGAVLAVLVCALGTAMWDRRVGLALTALVCVQPMSVVFSMAYSEPVFLVFVTGALLAAYRKRWLVAGLLTLAAGLTRPTGAALALALGVAAVMHVRNRDNGPRRWWALAAAGLGALGVPAYLAWVARRLGEPSAWFKVQSSGWGTSFDYGAMVVTFVRDAFRAGDGWVQVSVACILVAAVVFALVAVWQSAHGVIWPPLVVYGLVALGLVVGQAGYYHSKPRLLVPVLVTLVPAALALGRARPRTAATVLVVAGLFGLWYGAYMITVWRYAI